MAQALALPPALENLARELDLKHQKDMAGARVMAALSKPRKQKVSAGEDLGGTYYNDDSIPSASPLGKQAMRISRGI